MGRVKVRPQTGGKRCENRYESRAPSSRRRGGGGVRVAMRGSHIIHKNDFINIFLTNNE